MTRDGGGETMQALVMAGVERLIRGDGAHAFLSDEEQNLVLIIFGRTLMQFCEANAGKHEE